MTAAQTTVDSIPYVLVDELQYAIKTAILGTCLGAGVALSIGGPVVGRALLGGVLTVTVAGGLYWALLTLAAYHTGNSRAYRLDVTRASDRPQDAGAAPDGGRATDHRSDDDA